MCMYYKLNAQATLYTVFWKPSVKNNEYHLAKYHLGQFRLSTSNTGCGFSYDKT